MTLMLFMDHVRKSLPIFRSLRQMEVWMPARIFCTAAMVVWTNSSPCGSIAV